MAELPSGKGVVYKTRRNPNSVSRICIFSPEPSHCDIPSDAAAVAASAAAMAAAVVVRPEL